MDLISTLKKNKQKPLGDSSAAQSGPIHLNYGRKK